MKAGFWLVAAIVLAAQTAPPQPPAFRSGVDIVRLDVSVLDKDRRPVRDLTRDDITILVDGQPQPIVSFEPVAFRTVEPPTAPWMRDVAPDVRNNALGEPRLFVLLMDDATTPADPAMLATARKIAHGIIDQMNASDLAAVVFTMNNSHAQEFTGDRRLLRAAVDHFSVGMPNNPLASKYSANVLKEVMKALRTRPHGRNAIMLISASPVRSEEVDAMGSEMQQMADLAADLNGIQAATRFAAVPIYGFNIAGLVVGGGASAANEIFRTLADMTGGRAIVDDNEPARSVPAVFEEMTAFAAIIPVVPTTKRDFQRSDRAKAFVRIYRGAKQPAGPVDVTARVTDANGAVVASKAEVVSIETLSAGRSADYAYDLAIATLSPGAYLLTIEAKLGSIAARRDVRFSVR